MSRRNRPQKSSTASGEPGGATGPPEGESPAGGLTALDLHLYNEGTHRRIWEKLGAHPVADGSGVRFAVWAPNAERVAVVGDFNDWDSGADLLEPRGSSGIWEGVVAEADRGDRYKYHVHSRNRGYREYKADPVGFRHECPPASASVVWDLEYGWGDAGWMEERSRGAREDRPVSVYEVHPGSWRRKGESGERTLSYRELAPRLADYVKQTGFTHVELLPVMEHPFYGSWGYQVTGYFAPTSRYGTPQDFMYLVDHLHQEGIGVILDWVPSHFPTDAHGLAYFDGSHLYEHADPRQGYHPDWNSLIFNYGRAEVRSFLLSSGLFWLDVYHADGLRVDAVASMLYLDYSREAGEWIPNRFGGRENLEAIELLRELNSAVREERPGAFTVAEESTAWPDVSRPAAHGGLGFDMKWDMGWMHDTLEYMAEDPVHRRYHHDRLTFRQLYAWSEDFMLPLSHDEVVHGKGSLLEKMPGDDWQKFANLRLLLGYQWAQPGKKLLFMGGEFGQRREWRHDESLDWRLVEDGERNDVDPRHGGVQRWVRDLNRAYRGGPGLHELDFDPSGFQWVVADDRDNSVVAFLRKGRSTPEVWLVVGNFTPVPRENYRVGVPRGGWWEEALNSDAEIYGGSGRGNMGGVEASPLPRHGRSHSVTLQLPPLAILFLRAAPGVTPP